MKVDGNLLMTIDEGIEWHKFKASLGPLYPGYENFYIYMDWLKEQFASYGCVDFLEHNWIFNTYRVNDWPDHQSGALRLVSDGVEVPVGTFMMCSASTGEEGLSAPMVFHDAADGDPKDGEFEGKIAVIRSKPFPEKPYSEEFMKSYVITDTNYRTEPSMPADLLETVDPTENCSWNNRWEFFQWAELRKQAEKGKAVGLIIASSLTYGALEGLYDRQPRNLMPALVLDRKASEKVIQDAKYGKNAVMTLVSKFWDCENRNFICFLPGVNYGTDKDEYISLNAHVDGMSLTQDNGSLGILGICRYFSKVPQDKRKKTLLVCIDTRHFIENGDWGANNWPHDPYQVHSHLITKITATVGLEHMGEMEGAADYENNTMVPTGRPEITFMRADDNDFCARVLIEAVADSGLERADVKIDNRPGIHGKFKGWVRAVMAYAHKLNVCEIGQAGNWPGAHTQTFSGMQYFGSKKFRDEVHVWTQVVANMMEVDSIVYDVMWSKINVEIRKLFSDGIITQSTMEELLGCVSSIFKLVEQGKYDSARQRTEDELICRIDSTISIENAGVILDEVNHTLSVLTQRAKL